jgi:hypothetical protein
MDQLIAAQKNLDIWIENATAKQIEDYFEGVAYVDAITMIDLIADGQDIKEENIKKIVRILQPTIFEHTAAIKKMLEIIESDLVQFRQNNIYNHYLESLYKQYQSSYEYYLRIIISLQQDIPE